jgi:hypothetical protein
MFMQMLSGKDFINIKQFKPDDKVCIISKGYPVVCRVIEKKQKNETEGYYLEILDEDVITELGADKLWMPSKLIEQLVEA